MKAQRGGKPLSAPYISNLSLTSALDGDMWSTPRRGRFVAGKRHPLPNSHKAGWASDSVRCTENNLPLAGVRTSYRPVRSESGEEEECQKVIVCIGAP